jgi:primosomal replication protein N
LLEKQSLRYTPAGIPVIAGRLEHRSEQMEAGGARKVECEISFVALGETAHWIFAASPGIALSMTGFLAAKSRHSKTPVFHVQTIEFLEGTTNG